MKVLVTGAGGQLAWELERSQPLQHQVKCLSRSQLDICDDKQLESFFSEFKPDAVINAAAYTAVDRAEQEQEKAHSVNAAAVGRLAELCSKHGAYLLHISTDFVFDGSGSRPYTADEDLAPLGVYGQTKADGEKAIAEVMNADWAIVRTAWVYSSHGANFVKTMLRLMAEKPALSVVGDQVGTPTWARGLAQTCWSMLETRPQGFFHWTDAGVASWYDFAVAIQSLALQKGLLKHVIPIKPIASEDYPTPAKRPAYSVLDKAKILNELPNLSSHHWQFQLGLMMDELVAASA
ncbi:MAG: dTDP-4-dehydrorhamnose reductase [Lentisphaeria bacterium]|jgi:dTDP-4-dehydrorhamnose reductase